ncbi:sodium- and chloride-dependent glycine transporter 1-like isoform X4 [Mytilus californianus]|uniref:sodium- and chloride-dependent glycine transporter 1-like isoform X4 n=1 Tax=Mytilus californianus TaxID=6549 RepID=UPI002248649C|nr:sodium- and chloride-dependent glycine transporter 1-like isoform X4 [Mytilus californianus]
MKNESEDSTRRTSEREKWNNKIEYCLSIIGYLVGLGNLWRFPYICMRNGGGAFLIPFLFFLIFCGIPLFFVETAMGQFSGKGLLHVWDICPMFKGLGFGFMVPTLMWNVYYTTILGWALYYIGNSFISPLPWTTCNNEWNSPNCALDSSFIGRQGNPNTFSYLDTNATDNITHRLNITSSLLLTNQNVSWITAQEEFWQNNVLQMSSGIHEIGHLNWRMILCLFGGWVLIGLCIFKGVKSVGKVVYVTATLPYILLTIILIRGLTLDGSINGVIQYLQPDFSKLLNAQIWIEAAVQVCYSLGPGSGILITQASFNKFDNNCIRDSIMFSCISEFTSIFSGLVIFTVLGYMAGQLSIPLENIVKGGPGLAFIVYPEALSKLPGENVWSCIFFVMILCVGLDSHFVTVEAVIGVFTDSFQRLRRRSDLFTVAWCFGSFVLGLIFCTQGGIYIFQLVDWYVNALSLAIMGFLECIILGWIYGMERFSKDVNQMLGRGVPIFFRVCIMFVTPLIMFVLIMSTLIGYQPPTYGSYKYPTAAATIGTMLSILPIVPIFIFALVAIIKAEGDSIYKKIANALKPTSQWKPVGQDYEAVCKKKDITDMNLLEKIKLNLLGETNV